MRACVAAAASLALLSVTLAACGDDSPASREGARSEVGRGAASAVLWRPRRQTLPTVVFLHGWGAVDPRAYGPWMRHLVRRGSAVILPRYQLSALSFPADALPNAVRGVRAALARVPGQPWVAAGHSAGGALAADLAARAGREHLRAPLAVFAVNPGRGFRGVPFRLPASDLGQIAPDTRILALAGARDRVTGRQTAMAIVDGARRVPRAKRRFVLVTRPDAADHLAPQRNDSAAREVFWPALDRLIARVG
jgi:acetyl esterase/lipase